MAGKLDFLSRGRADVISRQSRRSRINSGGASVLVTAGLLKGNGDGMRLDEKKKRTKQKKKHRRLQDFDDLTVIISVDTCTAADCRAFPIAFDALGGKKGG